MIIVFAGPSLMSECCNSDLVKFLPPAKRGDIYTATKYKSCSAIVLIDGVFGDQPSVLHKEIQWALSMNIPVVGTSSIGAIRAVEMKSYGMIGLGWIYEAYNRGKSMYIDQGCELEVTNSSSAEICEYRQSVSSAWVNSFLDNHVLLDDDDVALIYAPAELQYMCISEPLVNIARTFELAPVSRELIFRALLTAKDTYFPRRTRSNIAKALRRQNDFSSREIDELHAWSSDCYVDQKQADACSAIEWVCTTDLDELAHKQSELCIEFIETVFWARLRDADDFPHST